MGEAYTHLTLYPLVKITRLGYNKGLVSLNRLDLLSYNYLPLPTQNATSLSS